MPHDGVAVFTANWCTLLVMSGRFERIQMNQIVENHEFNGPGDINTGRIIEDIELRRCDFFSCALSMGDNPNLRTLVRRVRLKDCRVRASFIGNALFDEVEVNGLDTGTAVHLEASAAVFRHVVLTGKIGRVMAVASAGLMQTKKTQEAFDAANAAFYRNVDWALDISKAEFHECDVMDVPYRLIKRDPETQVIVHRERVLDMRWQELDLMPYWRYCLDRMIHKNLEGMVLVAPTQNPKFKEFLKGLQILRKAGIAEQD